MTPQAKPISDTAERAVIGSILLDPDTVSIAREIAKPEDFESSLNRSIYEVMCHLADAGQPIDIATVGTPLMADALFKDAGQFCYLSEICANLPSAVNVERYAQLVRNDALRRKLAVFSAELAAMTQRPIEDPDELISRIGDKLANLAQNTANSACMSFKDVIMCSCAEMMQDGPNLAVKSGFLELDQMLSGFRPGSLTIIAARPAMGKTALGLNIMANAAMDAGITTMFFSLEMTGAELGMRILSARARVDSVRIKQMRLTQDDMSAILRAAEAYRNAPIYVDETPGLDISVIRERAKRMHRQHGIQLIIIDYLQLIRSANRRVQNREQEVADISRSLKALAKELAVPVIALAQLNRAVDSRPDKRPWLSDLRESGSVEQDADNVLFIHREGYYQRNPDDTTAEIIIAKQRSGPTGTVKLQWNGKYTLFENINHDEF